MNRQTFLEVLAFITAMAAVRIYYVAWSHPYVMAMLIAGVTIKVLFWTVYRGVPEVRDNCKAVSARVRRWGR